jgi:alpha-tubulin suppressor-like RCC1 family protein
MSGVTQATHKNHRWTGSDYYALGRNSDTGGQGAIGAANPASPLAFYGNAGSGYGGLQFGPKNESWRLAVGGVNNAAGIKTDGSLWTWGRAYNGEHGNGTTGNFYQVPQLIGTNKWVKLALGQYSVLAIDTAGRLWAWGYNAYNQLGDGTVTQRTSPVQIGSATNWKDIAINYYHSLGVKTNGTLWAWGYNAQGQLGDNTATQRAAPVQIGSATNWKQVATSAFSSAAVTTDGKAYGWGNNNSGEQGQGNTTASSVPLQMGSATNWKQVIAHEYSFMFLGYDGTIWGVGFNGYGQLANAGGNTGNLTTLTQSHALTSWWKLGTGNVGYHSLAIKRDGGLYGVGANDYGQTYVANQQRPNVFTQIESATNWVECGRGFQNSYFFTAGMFG